MSRGIFDKILSLNYNILQVFDLARPEIHGGKSPFLPEEKIRQIGYNFYLM